MIRTCPGFGPSVLCAHVHLNENLDVTTLGKFPNRFDRTLEVNQRFEEVGALDRRKAHRSQYESQLRYLSNVDFWGYDP